MNLKIRVLLLIFFIPLLLFLVYIGILTKLTGNLVKALEQKNVAEVKNVASHVHTMTGWIEIIFPDVNGTQSTCIVFQPFIILHEGSQLLLSAADTLDRGTEVFETIFSYKDKPFTEVWQDFYTSETETRERYQQFEANMHVWNVNKWFGLLGYDQKWQRIEKSFEVIQNYEPQLQLFIDNLPALVGSNGKKTYVVLLQNNMELRPTGGFIGSYATITFENGILIQKDVQDIYVPDGALKGHVEPPLPIQEAFQLGEWRLRDGNWDPDFSHSAQILSWFFEKGGVETGDGMIAVNLNVIEDIFKIIGDITLPDYGQQITADTLYAVTQYQAEHDFFPGSTQKQNFMASLTNNLFLQAKNFSAEQKTNILKSIYQHLKTKDIQLSLKDPTIQNWIITNGWGGTVKWPKETGFMNDYFFLYESNLGVNKANCCVERNITQTIRIKDGRTEGTIEIAYTNNSPVPKAKPPKYWGGTYKNYLRILLPENTTVKYVYVNNRDLKEQDITQSIRENEDLREVGFFVTVPHLQTVPVSITYEIQDIPQPTSLPYRLYIQKQSGLSPFWYTLELSDGVRSQQIKKLIDHDMAVILE